MLIVYTGALEISLTTKGFSILFFRWINSIRFSWDATIQL